MGPFMDDREQHVHHIAFHRSLIVFVYYLYVPFGACRPLTETLHFLVSWGDR
jgi:hypothetical protein